MTIKPYFSRFTTTRPLTTQHHLNSSKRPSPLKNRKRLNSFPSAGGTPFGKAKRKNEYSTTQRLKRPIAEQHSAWAAAKEEHEQAQAELAEAFTEDLQHDREFQERVLESELQQLDWPRETLIDFELEQTSSGLTLHIDVDFPDPESFPSREASFSKNQKRLLIKNKSTTQQRKEYAQHVHGALFRVIGVAFVYTGLNLSEIEIAGYRQILPPGHRASTRTKNNKDLKSSSRRNSRSAMGGTPSI